MTDKTDDNERGRGKPRPASGTRPSSRPRGDGPRKPFAGKPFAGKPAGKGFGAGRPRDDRPRDDRPRDDRPRDGRPGDDRPRSFAPRPPRDGDRPFRARPAGDRPFDDRPRDDRPRDDRPRDDRPGDDRPRSFAPRPPRDGDRPFRARPAGDRPFGDRPRPDRAGQDRPQGERRFDDRPRGFAPRPPRDGDRPFRARPVGDRPRDERPREDRPRDDRPRHDGPRGERRFDERPRSFAPRDGDRPRFDRPRFDGPRHEGPRDGERPRFQQRPPSGEGPRFAERPRSARPVAPRSAPPIATPREDGKERIAKAIARVGVASRRDVEEMIAAGRIMLNGIKVEAPGTLVEPGDIILVDGKPLPGKEKTRLWLYHKTPGLVTTEDDPEGRPTVFSALPADLPRVVSIGRLDINTEGLLLLTNDGGLARVLAHPSTGWLRRYKVRAYGDVTQDVLDRLIDGITIDDIHYGPIEARIDRQQGDNIWLTMGIREGKNREVKRVLEHIGLRVNRLIRLSFGPFQLGDLAEGAVEEVRTKVIKDQLGAELAAAAGVSFDLPLRDVPLPVTLAEPVEKLDHQSGRKPGEPSRAVWRDAETEGARPMGTRKPRRGDDPVAARAESATRERKRAGEVKSASGRRVLVEKMVPVEGDSNQPDWSLHDDRLFRVERNEAQQRPERGRDRDERGPRPPRDSSDRPRGPRPDRGDRPQGRSFGDRPPRADRPAGDRPFRDARPPRDDAPRADKPFRERPAGFARPERGDRPDRGERPPRRFDDRPGRDGPPRGDGRPAGKPFGKSFDKPGFGGRSGGDRPEGGAPRGARPGGFKPGGGKPGGGGFRPGGGKPGGGFKGGGGRPGPRRDRP